MLESVRVAQNHRFSGIDPTTRRTHLIRGCPASTCLPVWHSSVLLSPGLFARRRAEPGGRKRIAHGASRGPGVSTFSTRSVLIPLLQQVNHRPHFTSVYIEFY